MSQPYDARVGFVPRRGIPEAIYALVKQTWRGGRLDSPEPLTRDLLRPDAPSELEVGSDCWIDRPWVDVIVEGSAYAMRPVQRMTIAIQVGRHDKRVEVIGRRLAQWSAAQRIAFTEPEPFTQMELGLDRAYGGIDLRVPMPEPTTLEEAIVQTHDHPGLYPRNPYGRGYVVVGDAPRSGRIELPNLEDPDDRLTPDRLVVEDPRLWWRQPIPATVGLVPPNVFARYVFAGAQPWWPAPQDDRLPEVVRGVLPEGYASVRVDDLHPSFWQEASPGLRFPDLPAGTPIAVEGMHPRGHTARFVVPPAPKIEIDLEGRCQDPELRLTKVVIRPAEDLMTLTWAVRTDRMHRIFVPGIHAKIPLALRVSGGPPVPYVTPLPVRAALQEAMQRTGGLPEPPRPRPPRTIGRPPRRRRR